jgi:DNA-binding winged helix-turn-helix (wHTH) protein/Flp pilus assembly protein TadD
LLYVFDDYALDLDRRELRCGFTSIDIEPQVFDLLEYLIRHRERVVSRDELIGSIWGGRIVSESALNTRISAVRSAVGDSGTEQRLVKTLPRKGVRFIGEVREEQRTAEEAASPSEGAALQASEPVHTNGSAPAWLAIDVPAEAPSPSMPVPVKARPFAGPRAAGILAAVGLICFGVLTWSYFAWSAQSKQTEANIGTAAKLTHLAGQINMTSRGNYDAVRGLGQWAVDLDPHNATAQARLTFAIVTGVLNGWSSDVGADLQAANSALQDAIRIAPDDMMVRGAQCHILRAMRQFEVAIQVCSKFAKDFPKYPFLHKEIGYNEMMLGRLDDALAEFLEADRIAPDSRLRWSWNQGIGLIYLMRGQDQQAIDRLSRAALEAPDAGHPSAYLASAYALVGREQEAHAALDHYMKLWPKTSLNNFGPMVGTAAFNAKMERVREGLRLAGLT